LNAGVETHALDVLVYQFTPKLEGAEPVDITKLSDKPTYRLAGRTCLAGDVFGDYAFDKPVKIGDELVFPDMASYTMVKKNFFNGIKMPAIYHKNLAGDIRLAQKSTYQDFRNFLS